MSGTGILDETLASIQAVLGDEFERVTVERVVIGLFFTGVKLSSGHVGACATPAKAAAHAAGHPACCEGAPDFAARPGQMRGIAAAALVQEIGRANAIGRAVGIATINALAELCWERRPPPDAALEVGIDAFDAAAIKPDAMVVLVGAFAQFLRELKRRRQPYLVLEQNPALLKPQEMPFYRPAEKAASVVPHADVLVITGMTLINDTLDALLAAARPDACKVIVGPTVGLMPEAYFRRGCDILGGIRVTRGDEFLDTLAEGGSGRHFFGVSAQKVVLRSLRRLRGRSDAAMPASPDSDSVA
jgi:uncharacterized protein (DUF4213/DUF364 family)